jgi:hypothetical protein
MVFVKRYRGITFFTVKGAGHQVSKHNPESGVNIVQQLIAKSKLE